MRVLAICGSLRRRSSNRAALDAARMLAPDDIELVFADIGSLPLFNPDLDVDPLPEPVKMLRNAIASADALLISSPEYARGVAGAMKNALDWLVSGPEFPEKPVALINTSPRATHADAALRLTLVTMSARLIEPACITLPLLGRDLDAVAIAADPALAETLRAALDRLVRAAKPG